eukprot:TRINITY_DN3194_c0_g2_i1.p1 TRINITY_DN3194_c0_g2~~TRINITY_DN3194_c0_g2_i1.p1  ORF type:complete len:167 (+),score=37.38 TRINITY_DN3194_c0_g2_i1:99-599(+)
MTRNWDFSNLDVVSGKTGLEDPIGYRMTMDNEGKERRGKSTNQDLLNKKAWETAIAPIQSVGMNLFMLWMSGSSPGIFNVMILGYCLSSIIGQYGRINQAFANFKTIDTTLQKLSYFGLCSVSLGYLLWHMSGMGLLPTSSGDWINLIHSSDIYEMGIGVTTGTGA